MKIKNLTVEKSSKIILEQLNIEFEPGKIHIVMGPNGSGKSTLSNAIVGHPDCIVQNGSIEYKNKEILELKVYERSHEGVFLAPQYPSVIEGVSHAAFLKEALNTKREKNNQEYLDEFDFLTLLKSEAKKFNFDPKVYIKNSLNFGYSGGEKKRNEILQISLLKPDFIILDEIDSGLDIEAMSYIAKFLNNYMVENPNTTIVSITHYPNFAKLLNFSKVHVLKHGKFVFTGDSTTIDTIENNGFGGF